MAIVQAVSERHPPSAAPKRGAVPTGFVDVALPRGGLERGAVHEWLGVAEPECESSRPCGRGGRSENWSPPLTLLVQIARQALACSESGSNHLAWIGQRIWPYAPALACREESTQRRVLAASLFVRAESARDRLWAADLALRSRCAVAVIADGSGLDLAATRRLQLAAEAGGALCLLARPHWERRMLSAAQTRWAVRCCPTWTTSRRWTVELLRCKGVQPTEQASSSRLWIVEREHATRHVAVVSDVLSRAGQAENRETIIRRTG